MTPPTENQPPGLAEIESWKHRDCNIQQLSAESRDALGRVEDIATVTISLRVRTENSPVDVKEYWLRTIEGWRVLWKGIPAPATR